MSAAGTLLPHDWFPRALPANVTLGERSWCYSAFAFLHFRSRQACGVRVGHDTGIYHGTFFEVGPEGRVEIGDYATLVGATISTNARVVIGDYVFIAHEVVLADRGTAVPPWPDDTGGAEGGVAIAVDRNSWIGAGAILLRGARIGEGAVIGAAAVVDFEVPPFAIVAGNPARVVGSVLRPGPAPA